MIGPDEPAPPGRHPFLRAALRWLMAACVGSVASLSIFVLMTRVVDASGLVDRLFRVFPLIRTELDPDEACGDASLLRAVSVDGVVGTLRDGRVEPLADAVVVSEDARSGPRPVDVSAEGRFRVVAAFPDDRPSACPPGERAAAGAALHLVVNAPGCSERRVPVTQAWVPHSVLLECPDRR